MQIEENFVHWHCECVLDSSLPEERKYATNTLQFYLTMLNIMLFARIYSKILPY